MTLTSVEQVICNSRQSLHSAAAKDTSARNDTRDVHGGNCACVRSPAIFPSRVRMELSKPRVRCALFPISPFRYDACRSVQKEPEFSWQRVQRS
jgi:hypothetical protein